MQHSMLVGAEAAAAAADDASRQGAGVRTPTTAGHKRGRETPSSSPLARLLEQIRRLKLPSVDAATANRLLGPFVKEALRFDERGTLLAIVQQFGWQAGGQDFTQPIDLGSFSLLLQVCMIQLCTTAKGGGHCSVPALRWVGAPGTHTHETPIISPLLCCWQ